MAVVDHGDQRRLGVFAALEEPLGEQVPRRSLGAAMSMVPNAGVQVTAAVPVALRDPGGIRPAVLVAAPASASASAESRALIIVCKRSRIRSGEASVSLNTRQLHDARAAFLADWEHGRDLDIFAAWIEEALRAHASHTPTQRATLTVAASGQTRSFRVNDVVGDLLKATLANDCTTGQWISLSTWAAAAIAAATETTRQRGPLPTPPDRLPTRSKGDLR